MHEFLCLLGDGIRDGGVAMPERTDRDPAHEIRVFISLDIPDVHPLTFDEDEGLTSVGLGDVAPIEFLYALHSLAPFDHRAYASLGQDLKQEGMGHYTF